MANCEGCSHYSFFVDPYCDYWSSSSSKTFMRYWTGKDDPSDCPGYSGKSGSSSGCFLTSACVAHLGKADDCAELTTLRSFRDGYMKNSQEGKALVDEYYRIAPNIVKKIDASANKGCYYCYIYSVVEKCVGLINEGKNQETIDEYKAMVLHLKNQFA